MTDVEKHDENVSGRAVIDRGRRVGRAATVVAATLRALLTAIAVLGASPATAQEPRCRILCAPTLKIEPTVTVENLFERPTVETVEEGGVIASGRAQREAVFELIFALDIPTRVPRLGFTLEAAFAPFGQTPVNPFTGVSASELGRTAIRGNGVDIEAEFNLGLFGTGQTGGWASSHFDVVDKFSPAKQPDATSAYTHKLNFEWDTAIHVFNRLPDGHWLRHVEAEVSLDYVATGLPRAGDVFGDERFVQKASPWSISFLMVVPLAPLAP